MENKFKKISIIYFIAIILIAVVFMCGYAGVKFMQNEIVTTVLIQIIVMLGFPMLMYTLFVSKNIKRTLSDTGIKKVSFKILIFSVLIGIILYFINTFISNFFSSIIALMGYETLGINHTSYINYNVLFKEFLLTAIVPGICEEFMFRGLILHAGKKCKNKYFCLIISSILFGLTHLNINQFFYASIMGAMMGYVTIIADSIIPSMIMHFMNNFLSTYFYYGYYLKSPLALKYNQFLTFISSNFFLFICLSSLLIITLILLYVWLCKLIKNDMLKLAKMTPIIQNNDNTIVNQNMLLKLYYKKMTESEDDTSNEIILSSQTGKDTKAKRENKLSNNLFLISSIILGSLITISSFIWGVI